MVLRAGTRVAKPVTAMPHLERVDAATWGDREWERCYALHCRAHREQGTIARSFEAYRSSQLQAGDCGSTHTRSWVAREGGEIVGKLDLTASLPGHAALNVFVDPDARRRGVARALVGEALRHAGEDGVKSLEISMFQPEGWRLCERYGGRFARGGAQLTLRVAHAKWQVVDAWCQSGPSRSPSARLQELTDLPPALVPAFLDLYNRASSDQPHAEYSGAPLTLARRREQERSYERLGYRWITLVAREPNGVLAGMTDVIYDVSQYQLVRQLFTGVLPSHRGRGIAKWLKASMLRLVRQRFPAAVDLTTSNADENAPMIAINRRLGFSEPIPHRTYRFELGQLRAALETDRGAPVVALLNPLA
jgi:GNAT superfamily N-acetyltransferase